MRRYGIYKIFINYISYKKDFIYIQNVLSKMRMEMCEQEFIATCLAFM